MKSARRHFAARSVAAVAPVRLSLIKSAGLLLSFRFRAVKLRPWRNRSAIWRITELDDLERGWPGHFSWITPLEIECFVRGTMRVMQFWPRDLDTMRTIHRRQKRCKLLPDFWRIMALPTVYLTYITSGTFFLHSDTIEDIKMSPNWEQHPITI